MTPNHRTPRFSKALPLAAALLTTWTHMSGMAWAASCSAGIRPTVMGDGPFLVGIRDVAEQRSFRSGWTVTQWLPESVRARLWERYAVGVLQRQGNRVGDTEPVQEPCQRGLRLCGRT